MVRQSLYYWRSTGLPSTQVSSQEPMNHRSKFSAALGLCFMVSALAVAAQQQPGTENAARKIGTIKAINGKTVTLKPDSGPEVNIIIQDSTRLAQLPAGQTDLKAAHQIQLQQFQAGDRMLARGIPGADGQSVVASIVIVMKQADLAQKQQHDREDWQKRGVGGIVTAIDAASNMITISVTPTYSIAVKTSPKTTFLRY